MTSAPVAGRETSALLRLAARREEWAARLATGHVPGGDMVLAQRRMDELRSEFKERLSKLSGGA